MRRFFNNFGHQDVIALVVDVIEDRGTSVELIAEHQNEMTGAAHAGFGPRGPARRQASEHQRTCAQLRAQALRQVIGRPQAWQGLLGR